MKNFSSLEQCLGEGPPQNKAKVILPSAEELISRYGRRRRAKRIGIAAVASFAVVAMLLSWHSLSIAEPRLVDQTKEEGPAETAIPEGSSVASRALSNDGGNASLVNQFENKDEYQFMISPADANGRHYVLLTDGKGLAIPVGALQLPKIRWIDPLTPPDDIYPTSLTNFQTNQTTSVY